MLKLLGLILLTCYAIPVTGLELTERTDWQARFRDSAVGGVFVLCEVNHCQTNNSRRAGERFIPASTFKIPHSLIALETGVIASGRQLLPWDGQPRAYEIWQQDFNLRGAMQNSVVPVYQGFARRIGENQMQEHLNRLDYGNADIGGGIDRFWLDGDLRISAMEQIAFLRQLYADGLPFSEDHQLIVKDALLTEADAAHVLRAKSGYSLGMPGYGDRSGPGIGWWVGWVEKDTAVYFFAANFDIEQDSQLKLRTQLPRALMRAEGILSE